VYRDTNCRAHNTACIGHLNLMKRLFAVLHVAGQKESRCLCHRGWRVSALSWPQRNEDDLPTSNGGCCIGLLDTSHDPAPQGPFVECIYLDDPSPPPLNTCAGVCLEARGILPKFSRACSASSRVAKVKILQAALDRHLLIHHAAIAAPSPHSRTTHSGGIGPQLPQFGICARPPSRNTRQ